MAVLDESARRTGAAMALALALLGVACACTPSDIARENMKRESEQQLGVDRTVTAYSSTGEVIGEWHGRIDVEYAHDTSSGGVAGDRVDLVIFDGSEPVDRVIISGATVIVDND